MGLVGFILPFDGVTVFSKWASLLDSLHLNSSKPSCPCSLRHRIVRTLTVLGHSYFSHDSRDSPCLHESAFLFSSPGVSQTQVSHHSVVSWLILHKQAQRSSVPTSCSVSGKKKGMKKAIGKQQHLRPVFKEVTQFLRTKNVQDTCVVYISKC